MATSGESKNWLDELDAKRSIENLANEHSEYLHAIDLALSPRATQAVSQIYDLFHELQSGSVDFEEDWTRREDEVRLMLRMQDILTNGLEWASPAYGQSVRVNFYDPVAQSAPGANYARYGSVALRILESDIASMLGLDDNNLELLATSSGMAAYQLVESFLLRDVLTPGDTIAYAPYIYFEAAEQLEALPFFRHTRAVGYEVGELVETVEDSDARVLFVDPIANLPGLPVVDLEELASVTLNRPGWQNRWLVVDGTMISGALNIFDLFSEAGHPHVLYYESASKYAQFGLDLQMAGVCVVPQCIAARAHVIRRNTGTILYPDGVARFPRASRNHYLSRLRTMSENVRIMALSLSNDERISKHITLGWISDWKVRRWAHGGAILTVEFCQPELNNREGLQTLIDRMLTGAHENNTALVKGVSFGFSTTRVSASRAMAEDADPFLRFSMGVENPNQIRDLASTVASALAEYVGTFS